MNLLNETVAFKILLLFPFMKEKETGGRIRKRKLTINSLKEYGVFNLLL